MRLQGRLIVCWALEFLLVLALGPWNHLGLISLEVGNLAVKTPRMHLSHV